MGLDDLVDAPTPPPSSAPSSAAGATGIPATSSSSPATAPPVEAALSKAGLLDRIKALFEPAPDPPDAYAQAEVARSLNRRLDESTGAAGDAARREVGQSTALVLDVLFRLGRGNWPPIVYGVKSWISWFWAKVRLKRERETSTSRTPVARSPTQPLAPPAATTQSLATGGASSLATGPPVGVREDFSREARDSQGG